MTTTLDIDIFLTSWLERHGFDAEADYGLDFCVDLDSNVITYTFVVPSAHDEKFFELCHQICPDIIACDNFILSFFHEIGHIETEADFDEKDWEKYWRDCEKYTADDGIMAYYTNPIELAATTWACEYIINHVEEVKEFRDGYVKLATKFFKENGIELE